VTLRDLQIPGFRRKRKGQPAPQVVIPTNLEFTGEKVAELVDGVLAHNRHFTPAQLEEFRGAQKISAAARPNKDLGKLIGAMNGRWWYVA